MLDRQKKAHSPQPVVRGNDVARVGMDATTAIVFGEFSSTFWWPVGKHVVDQLLREIVG